MERVEKWTKSLISVQYSESVVTTISESEEVATVEFGELKNGNITGFSVKFKKEEIPNLIKQLEEFQEKCF